MAAPRESGRQCAPGIRVPRAEAAPVPERRRREDPEVRARRGSHAANPARKKKKRCRSGTLTAAEGRRAVSPSPEPHRSPGCARGGGAYPGVYEAFLHPGGVSAGGNRERAEHRQDGMGRGYRLRPESRERTQQGPAARTCRRPPAPRGSSTRVPAPGVAAADPGSCPAGPSPPLPGSEAAAPSGTLASSWRRWPPLQPCARLLRARRRLPVPGGGRPRPGESEPPARRAGLRSSGRLGGRARGWGAGAPAGPRGWDAGPAGSGQCRFGGSRRTDGRAPLGSGRRPPRRPLPPLGAARGVRSAGGRWHFTPGSQSRGGGGGGGQTA